MAFAITKGREDKPYKVVVYGVEGIGKTTLASHFPDPLFIDTEGSTTRMDVRRYPKPDSYSIVKQMVQEVIKTKPCQTLVIDSVDWLESAMIKEICDAAKKTSLTDFGYGNGFIKLEEEFGRFLDLLTEVTENGMNVVLTAHAKIVKFEQPNEQGAYDRWEMKLGNKTTAKTAPKLKEWADMVLFCNYETFAVAKDEKATKFRGTGGKRVMYTTHHPSWDAKNRDNLPEKLDLDYKYIAHLFDGSSRKQEDKVKEVFGQQNVTVVPADAKVDEDPEPLIKAYSPEDEAEVSKLPKELQQLMRADYVRPAEIVKVLKAKMQKGMPVPENAPMSTWDNIAKGFIKGFIIPNWGMIMNEITNNRVPF